MSKILIFELNSSSWYGVELREFSSQSDDDDKSIPLSHIGIRGLY